MSTKIKRKKQDCASPESAKKGPGRPKVADKLIPVSIPMPTSAMPRMQDAATREGLAVRAWARARLLAALAVADADRV